MKKLMKEIGMKEYILENKENDNKSLAQRHMKIDPEKLYQQGMDFIDKLKPAQAAECFRKAAEQGHAEAQYNLGICYEDGDGVEWSYEEAIKWYSKAAAQGHEEAKMLLDILNNILEGEERKCQN